MTDHVRLTLRSLLVGIVFFCATTAGLPLVHHQIKADVAETRVEAENLALLLDAHKTRTGAYPDRLDDVMPAARRSRLLNRHDTYHATSSNFVLRIRIPGHPLAGESYHSEDRRWRLE